ncbi:MAG: TlpA family protein disulfide reductase [Chitinophagales bacterium]
MSNITKARNSFFYFVLSFGLFFCTQSTHAQEIVEATHLDENVGGLQIGEQAPNLVLPNQYNSNSDLYAMSGKYIYLHFWASWCPCSQPHIPNYKVIYDKYQQANFVDANGFEIYSVSIDENDLNWSSAVEDYNMAWPHNVRIQDDNGNNQLLMWDVRSVPTAYIIDPSGVVIAKNPSLIEMDAILSERSDQPGPRKLGRTLVSNQATQNHYVQKNPNNEWNKSVKNSRTNNKSTTVESYTTDTQTPSSFKTYQQTDYGTPNYTNSVVPVSQTFTTDAYASNNSSIVIDGNNFNELKVNVGEFYQLTQEHVDAIKDLGQLEVNNTTSGAQSVIIKGLQNHDAAYQTLLAIHKRGFTDAFLTY